MTHEIDPRCRHRLDWRRLGRGSRRGHRGKSRWRRCQEVSARFPELEQDSTTTLRRGKGFPAGDRRFEPPLVNGVISHPFLKNNFSSCKYIHCILSCPQPPEGHSPMVKAIACHAGGRVQTWIQSRGTREDRSKKNLWSCPNVREREFAM